MAARLIGGRQHLLDAAEHDGHALRLRRLGIEGGFRLQDLQLQRVRRHERQRRGNAAEAHLGEHVAERLGEPADAQHEAEAVGVRQHAAQEPARRALLGGAVAALLDAHAGEIDQMHIVDVARAGGHAAEAGEAAVEVMNRRRRDVAALEHLLHEVDAAARAVALVAGQHIGRTGRRAQPAMDAAAQDLVGARDIRVAKLESVEIGLHGLSLHIPVHAARVRECRADRRRA